MRTMLQISSQENNQVELNLTNVAAIREVALGSQHFWNSCDIFIRLPYLRSHNAQMYGTI